MILKKIVKRKLIVQALSLAFMTGVASTAMVGTAYAQSNTTGSISGRVDSPAGATVMIQAVGGGTSRTVTPDANGRYQALSLPTGEYNVTLMRGGKVEKSTTATVNISGNFDASFNAAARIEITGRASRIDVSNTNSGTTFTAKDLEKIPVAANIGAVLQLAPSAVPGDPRYGGNNAPSFGGASASENAYYINGFPVTNGLLQIGFSSLPFGSMSEIQILEGGYGAEFGRSTGGVVNMTTKRGTNRMEVGAAVQWSPKNLRSAPKNALYPKNGTASDGKIRIYSQDDTIEQVTYSAEVGGPIIKDNLFFYFAAEEGRVNAQETRGVDTSAFNATAGWQERKVTLPKYLAKLDWNITNDHHLEYTGIRDEPKDERTYYGFNFANKTRNNINGGGVLYKSYNAATNGVSAAKGGDTDIFKYTGNFGQSVTVTAVAGKSKTNQLATPAGYNPALPLITVTDVPVGIAPVSAQAFNASLLTAGAFYETQSKRLDFEYRLNDQHTLRAGFDNVEIEARGGEVTPGGIDWRYQSIPCATPLPGPAAPAAPVNFATVVAGVNTCYYVQSAKRDSVSTAGSTQSAQYIEDRWQVTDRLMLSLGLRNEEFENINQSGQVFVKQNRQIEPRIGAAWDMNGNGSTKIFGNLGRYHLQLPTNVALRGAGASLFLDRYYSYTGVNAATGEPTGLTALDVEYSPNNEVGTPKETSYIAAQDLKSHYQDELAIGIEQAFNKDLNGGFKITYRKLKSSIEDLCDDRPFLTWAAARGLNPAYFSSKWSCSSFNPGETNTWNLDIDGNGTKETIVLTPQDLANGLGSFPKTKRTYLALDFYAEHPFDGKWYGKVNYTYSKSRGNTEGQLNSDFGQADPGATLTADHFELTQNADGRLPNDRTHVIKGQAFYNLTSEWSFGANVFLASGRPKSAIGNYCLLPNILGSQDYGAAYFCSNLTGLPVARGSVGELPWQARVDLSATYKPEVLQGVQFRADMFNVSNNQVTVQQRDSTSPLSRYQLAEAYSAPRSFRFTAQYNKKF